MKTDTTVVGGGIVGLITALTLLKLGWHVSFIDDLDPKFAAATDAAGAMLCPFTEISGDESEASLRSSMPNRLEVSEFYQRTLIAPGIAESDICLRRGPFFSRRSKP